MRYKSIFIILLAFFGLAGLIGISNECVLAQEAPKETGKIKNFGKSLKKYGKKTKPEIVGSNQKKSANEDDEIITVKTDLVTNDILVVNEKGNPLLGLKREDFIITEDGVPQEVGLFSFGENAALPRSIVLIIDGCVLFPEHLNYSVEAAKNLVDKLAPQDKLAIITDQIQLLTNFTNDKVLLKKNLDSLKRTVTIFKEFGNGGFTLSSDGGRGEQFSSLLASLNELFNSHSNARPIVIVQSGGGELFLLKPIYKRFQNRYRERNFSLQDVLDTVEKSSATIHPIILQPPLLHLTAEQQDAKVREMFDVRSETNWGGVSTSAERIKKYMDFHREEYVADQTAQVNIAKMSGGYPSYFAKPEDAEGVYSDILNVINSRYVIGYYPLNQERNGKLRNIKIEVRGHPEYSVLGRKTYFPLE